MSLFCQHALRTAGRLPGVSLSVVSIALALLLWPGTVTWLAYTPDALARAEWWRVPGSHLVHWSFDHALWDTLAFLLIGSWCESIARRRMVAATVASAAIIPPAVLWAQPDLTAYAGLSGLDVALAALLVTHIARQRWTSAGPAGRLAMVAAAGVITVKLVFEVTTGDLWFVRSHAGDFVPTPLAHVVGAMVGVVVAIIPTSGPALSPN